MNVTLNDIAGYEIEKKEALKIINFLKNYEEYKAKGIELTKGLLLSGAPGVGKTLLAKAIATESSANFVELKNNDDFIVDNIRKTFAKAKEMVPSILFIDELDEIVTNSYGEVTDLQKRTLQTFLTEIDGLEGSNGIIVIATCNSKRRIPEALLRSGRIEKHMTLSKPNYEARCEIFDFYLSKHPSLKHIDREMLAKKSNGLTGADINNLTNEVLLECMSLTKTPTIDDFERYIPSILYKDIRRENEEDTLEFVVAHELGHFICAYALKKEISSISVEKYGEVAGFVSREKEKIQFAKYSTLMDDIMIHLGGLAGEIVFLNDMTTGASSDVENAYSLVTNMMNVGTFGFEYYKIDKRNYNDAENVSEHTLKKRAEKASEIMDDCLARAVALLEKNRHIYDALKDELLLERRLSAERIIQILNK